MTEPVPAEQMLRFPSFRSLYLFLPGTLVAFWLLYSLGESKAFADNYLIAAQRSIMDLKLFTSDRPPGIYLLYKLCGYNIARIISMQALASAVAFALLGWALAQEQQSRTARIAAMLVFPLGACAWNVAGWNHVLLTESLAFSEFALVYTALVWLYRNASWPRYLLLFAIAVLTGFTRDQNTYIMALMAGLIFVTRFGPLRRPNPERRRLILFVLALLTITLLQSNLASQGRRHMFSLYNVLFQRILGNEDYETWFAEQGAPIELVSAGAPHEWRGEWCSSHDWALFLRPEYQPMKEWNIQDGKSCFARFLLTHPIYLTSLPWRDRSLIFSEGLVDYTGAVPNVSLTRWATALWTIPLLFFALPTMTLYAFMWAKSRATTLVPLIFALMAFAGGLLAYHADAMEVQRHCIAVVFGLRCALFHIGLRALDLGLLRWKGKTQQGTEART